MVKMLKGREESLFHNSSKSNGNLIFTGTVYFSKSENYCNIPHQYQRQSSKLCFPSVRSNSLVNSIP